MVAFVAVNFERPDPPFSNPLRSIERHIAHEDTVKHQQMHSNRLNGGRRWHTMMLNAVCIENQAAAGIRCEWRNMSMIQVDKQFPATGRRTDIFVSRPGILWICGQLNTAVGTLFELHVHGDCVGSPLHSKERRGQDSNLRELAPNTLSKRAP